jgi:DNA repair exonuclease SbcCD ATPase subunit
MKIIQLHAENFKRLGIVEITPEGNVVTIGGNNGEGKSSVLDAIFVALKGRAVAPPKPIRKGEEKCTIRLDMGDLIVTRTFHQKEGEAYTDNLKVESAEGLRYATKPQDVLNALLGEVGFDPFEFVNLKPDQQAARLLEMVPLSIDLDEFAQKDQSDYANRRDTNRDVERLRAQLVGIPEEEVPEDTPDRAALAEQLGNAADTNAGIERERMAREVTARNIAGLRDAARDRRDRAALLRRQADGLDEEAATDEGNADAAAKQLAELPALAGPVDTVALREQLTKADAVLATIDRQGRRKALAGELAAAEAKSQGYTDAMAERAKQRNQALAEAEMPVPGLAFAINEAGKPVLTYEGLPFEKDQISTAVQLRVSTAIGMAANPRLRVLRISDGSLLDKASMQLLTEMAEAEDFQLWVEVVGDGGVGIVMENGLVRGADTPEADEPAAEEAPAKPAAKAKGKPAGEKLL